MGIGDSSGASGGLRVHLAGRSVPFRPCRLDASQPYCQSGGWRPGADPHDAGPLGAAPQHVIKIEELGALARAVVETLRSHVASFYDEIVQATGLLRTQVEDALAELVRSEE